MEYETHLFSAFTEPRGNRDDKRRLSVALFTVALPLILLAVAGCARIGNPEGWSGGLVVGDTLYMGTREGELRALDRYTGDILWAFALQGEESERAVYGTPAVADDTLYLGGYDAVLYALSLEGDVKWRERVAGPIVGGPTVVDNLVLVGSGDEDSTEGNLYAFETEGGFQQWRFRTEGKVWSTPAVADGVVYVGSLDHNIYAVSLEDGSLVWKFATNGAVAAKPVVARGRVYVGSFDSVLYAIDTATGEEVWRFEEASNWYWTHVIIAGDTLYAPSLDGNLYALDIDTGEMRWTLRGDGPIVGSPALVHDLIAVPSAEEKDWKIRLIRLADGSEQHACNIGEEIRTSLAEENGFIYFAARDRSIRALEIKPNGNPDERWVHFTDRDDPLPRDQAPAC